MGRAGFGGAVRGRDSYPADCRRKRRQCTSGNRASRYSHGRPGRSWLDFRAIRCDVESIDCGHWIRMDGWFRAHSLRGRTRFLHALMARQGPPALCHALCCADRAGNCLRTSRSGKFLWMVVLGQTGRAFGYVAAFLSDSGRCWRSVSETSCPSPSFCNSFRSSTCSVRW